MTALVALHRVPLAQTSRDSHIQDSFHAAAEGKWKCVGMGRKGPSWTGGQRVACEAGQMDPPHSINKRTPGCLASVICE